MAKYFKNPAGPQGHVAHGAGNRRLLSRAQNRLRDFSGRCGTGNRFRRYENEEVAKIAAENSDIMIPFASIDPAKGKAGAREARRLCVSSG